MVVVWEGMEGAGKTTLMKRVGELIKSRGFKVSYYKTPSNSPTGRFAADYGNRPGIDPLTRMLLFLANTSSDSRIMKEKIRAERPHYFFIDRYYLCSIIYGLAYAKLHEVDVSHDDLLNLLRLIEKLGSNVFIKPDIHVIVDVEEDVRMKRLGRRVESGRLDEKLEKNTRMQELVREFYRVFHTSKPDYSLWVENIEGRLDETAEYVARRILSSKTG